LAASSSQDCNRRRLQSRNDPLSPCQVPTSFNVPANRLSLEASIPDLTTETLSKSPNFTQLHNAHANANAHDAHAFDSLPVSKL
ncbi:hypothetical protein DOTSEDRAFT_46403, partial [Dothistroma septosporum NZE10]